MARIRYRYQTCDQDVPNTRSDRYSVIREVLRGVPLIAISVILYIIVNRTRTIRIRLIYLPKSFLYVISLAGSKSRAPVTITKQGTDQSMRFLIEAVMILVVEAGPKYAIARFAV